MLAAEECPLLVSEVTGHENEPSPAPSAPFLLALVQPKPMVCDCACVNIYPTPPHRPQALAQSNAAVLRHAARALIRNCDTLGLMQRSARGSAPAQGAAVLPAAAAASDKKEEAAAAAVAAQQEEQSSQAPGAGSRGAAGAEGGAGEEAGEEEQLQQEGGMGPAEREAGRIAALLCFDEMQVRVGLGLDRLGK